VPILHAAHLAMVVLNRYSYSPRQKAEGGHLSPIPSRRRRPSRRIDLRASSPNATIACNVYAPDTQQKISKVSSLPALIDVRITLQSTSKVSAPSPPKEEPFQPTPPTTPPSIRGWQRALRGRRVSTKVVCPTVDEGRDIIHELVKDVVKASGSVSSSDSGRSRGRSQRKYRPCKGASNVFLVPARAEEKCNQFRYALRVELDQCETVAALEKTNQEASVTLVKAKRGPLSSHTIGAQLFNDILWGFDPGVAHYVWRSTIQQVVDQEMLRRRQGILDLLNTLDDESEQEQNGSDDNAKHSGLHTNLLNHKAGNDQSHPDPLAHKTQDELAKQGTNEILYRTAFGRLSSAFKLRQADVPKALEKCGVPYPNKQWVDESYTLVAKTDDIFVHKTSISSDEFVEFVRTYFERQQLEYCNTFEKFDADKSGVVDVTELKKVLKSFGIEPLLHVLEEVIGAVDNDGSGLLSLPEFIGLMELINVCGGFTKPERQELTKVYNRFATNGKGILGLKDASIPTGSLASILTWLGYSMASSDVKAIAMAVDVDCSGSLDLHEFLICMRKVREWEIQALNVAIQEHDADGSNSLSVHELEALLTSLGYVGDRQAMLDAARDSHANLQDMHLDDLSQFVQVYRCREGLSCDECDQVDAAFKRYDAAGKGEMSTIDTGKALRFFGYQVPFLVLHQITDEVDVDNSGTLDRNELRKLIRFYWEAELKKMHRTFDAFKDSKNLCPLKDLDKAFRAMDFVDPNCNTPVAPDSDPKMGGVDRATFMSVGIEFKKVQRDLFRESAGYSHAEVEQLLAVFRKYDTDHSDSIKCSELGQLVKVIFPVMNANIRQALDLLMKEIDADGPGTGSLSFDDFLRTLRQFHDIQSQERFNKMDELVAESGFDEDEVSGFRELFMSSDLSGDGELCENEIRRIMQNVCPLGQKNSDSLHSMLTNVRKHVEEERGPEDRSNRWGAVRALTKDVTEQSKKNEMSHDSVDFPEFLLFMRQVLDTNFANVKNTTGNGKAAAKNLS